MTGLEASTYCNVISAALALASGAFWSKSALSSVSAPDGMHPGVRFGPDTAVPDDTGRVISLYATIRKQSRWNKWAAFLAAGAAFCQVLAALLK
jgi:hypothetical protein